MSKNGLQRTIQVTRVDMHIKTESEKSDENKCFVYFRRLIILILKIDSKFSILSIHKSWPSIDWAANRSK